MICIVHSVSLETDVYSVSFECRNGSVQDTLCVVLNVNCIDCLLSVQVRWMH